MTDIVKRLCAAADGKPSGSLEADAVIEIQTLRFKIAMLENELATTLGTIKPAAREADEPFRVNYDQSPNTPR